MTVRALQRLLVPMAPLGESLKEEEFERRLEEDPAQLGRKLLW